MLKEKDKMLLGINYKLQVNAMMIKQQLQEAKERSSQKQEAKERERKEAYLQRVKEERKKKKVTDKQGKQLAKIELELAERVNRTKEIYKSLKPVDSTHTSMLILDESRY